MFDHILVPLDGSRLAECVLPHVVAVAHAFGSQVTLLQVLEQTRTAAPPRFIDSLSWRIGEAEATAYLDTWASRLGEAGLRAASTCLEGRATECIAEAARDTNADLIVLSTHGQSGLSGWNINSTALEVVMSARLPTMIVRAYQPVVSELTALRYRRLLVPVDCSRRDRRVLSLAATLARCYGSELLAAYVVCRPQLTLRLSVTQKDLELVSQVIKRNRQEAIKYLSQLSSWLDVNVRARLLVSGNPAITLHDLVERENVDLVVLGAHSCSSETKWPCGYLATNFTGYGITPLLIVPDLRPEGAGRTGGRLLKRETSHAVSPLEERVQGLSEEVLT